MAARARLLSRPSSMAPGPGLARHAGSETRQGRRKGPPAIEDVSKVGVVPPGRGPPTRREDPPRIQGARRDVPADTSNHNAKAAHEGRTPVPVGRRPG